MISTLWNAQGIASRSSRATARIRQESCCLAKMMIQNLPLFTPNLPLQMLCRSYFGVFERWEPMLAWVRVAAIEHPVRAGQPWETPNKALDQELIGKTCGKSEHLNRCKTSLSFSSFVLSLSNSNFNAGGHRGPGGVGGHRRHPPGTRVNVPALFRI